MDDETYTAKEAMAVLKISSSTFYRRVRDGEIPYEAGRPMRFPKFAIDTLAGWAHDKDILRGIDVLGNETLYLLTGNCSEGGVAEAAPSERRTGPPEIVNCGKLPDLLSQPVIFDQYYAASQCYFAFPCQDYPSARNRIAHTLIIPARHIFGVVPQNPQPFCKTSKILVTEKTD